jgi:hypothetical protein
MPFKRGKVCPPTTSEAGARWPIRGGTNSTKSLMVLRNGPHDHSPDATHRYTICIYKTCTKLINLVPGDFCNAARTNRRFNSRDHSFCLYFSPGYSRIYRPTQFFLFFLSDCDLVAFLTFFMEYRI